MVYGKKSSIKMVKSFKDLEVWKKSVQLVKRIYALTSEFPKQEVYILVNQMCRAVISIPSNIAEGKSRQSKKEYVQFLYVALGSLSELETQVIISRDLGYINKKIEASVSEEINHIERMLRSLIASLNKNRIP
jgi:four helix bundle protein